MSRALVAAAVVVACWSAPAVADQPAGGRSETIATALATLRQVPEPQRARWQREIYLGGRRDCRASFGAPSSGCLLAMAARVCAGEAEVERASCLIVADLLLVNSLAEHEWVSDRQRVDLMNSGDFRAAMDRELLRRYAVLTGEMTLSPLFEADAVAASIDHFCAGRSHRRPLAWQRCVAAITWYIGTATHGSMQ